MTPASASALHGERHFSSGYASARRRFRAAAQAAGANLHVLPLAARAPGGEPLSIDIAWLGAAAPARALLHVSGMHGVEAYAGSAIQLALLDAPPALHAGSALILVHVLNPYGMACSRRANENNVDLNRNFLAGDAAWSGAPPLYRALDPVLNPPTPPRRDAFLARAGALLLRHGCRRLTQAVAEGQYEFPRGLFYGGARLEDGPRQLMAWLREHCASTALLLALDVHTGLGRWARDTLLADAAEAQEPALGRARGAEIVAARTHAASAYAVRGGLGSGVRAALPHASVHCIVQEFGTYPLLKVIAALRDENRGHFYGRDSVSRASKARLTALLAPADAVWRRQVIARGTSTVEGGLKWLMQSQQT